MINNVYSKKPNKFKDVIMHWLDPSIIFIINYSPIIDPYYILDAGLYYLLALFYNRDILTRRVPIVPSIASTT